MSNLDSIASKIRDSKQQDVVVVTHDNCADGIVSALLCRDALPNAKILFVQYGTDKHQRLVPYEGKQYVFVDMTPHEKNVEAFVKAGAIVLDHHQTASKLVGQFGDLGVYADETGVSGASLAYKHVWMPFAKDSASEEYGSFVDRFSILAGVYDTWQKSHPSWADALAQTRILHFASNDDWLGMGLPRIHKDWDFKFAWLASILARKSDRSTQRAIFGAEMMHTARGTRVGIVNLRGVNDVSEALAGKIDLMVGFNYEIQRGQRMLLISLRTPSDYDCASLAKSVGGGGHRSAAGCSVPVNESMSPYTQFLHMIDSHEKGSAQ